jgi:hypothetical protein
MIKHQPSHTARTFQGVTSPNTTQVPDQYFDELLAELTGAELKVLLYITRRTFGFKKDSDNISLGQICKGIRKKDGTVLDRGTGLSRSTAIAAIRKLLQRGVINSIHRTSTKKGNEATAYSLVLRTPQKVLFALDERTPWSENHTREEGEQSLVRKSYQGSSTIEPALVRKSNPQETVQQDTISNSSSNVNTSGPTTRSNNGRTGMVQLAEIISRAKKRSAPDHSHPTLTMPMGGSTGGQEATERLEAEKLPGAQKSGRVDGVPPLTGDTTLLPDHRRQLNMIIDEISTTLGDGAHRASNQAQILNIWVAAHLAAGQFGYFVDGMYASLGITRERAGAIRGSKMSYFFTTLRNRLGVAPARRQDVDTPRS